MKIGYTTGVFDLFHIGHLNILRRSKANCDKLIVGVTTDDLAEKRKGKRPVIPFEERSEIIKSIKYVDEVVSQKDMDKVKAWKKYDFDSIFVGDDWKGTKKWNNLEKEFKKRGVEVKYFPYTKTTSSTILTELIENEIGRDESNRKTKNYNIVIHLGLHKTGTTFLQKKIFKKIKNINYIPEGEASILKSNIVKDKINLISLERLSGKPYRIVRNEDTRFITAYRLWKMFPNAKIIIGTREKEDWLKSLYNESVVKGNDKKYNEWKNLINKEYLDIENYVSFLKKMFPSVYEYKFEDFKKNNHKIIKEICEFIGAEVPKYKGRKVRESLPNFEIKILRFLNKFFRSRGFHPERKIPRPWIAIPFIRK